MTPEQLQAQIDEDYDALEWFIEDYGENSDVVKALQSEITENEKQLAIMTGKGIGQIIALTDKNTVSLFN